MKITNNNMSMIRGDSESFTVGCRNYEFQEGDIVEFTVRKRATSPERVLYKRADSFEIGKATFCINPEDTSGLNFGEYVYDIQLTKNDGVVKTIVPISPFILGFEVTYE